MQILARILNFVFGMLGVMLILLGVTTPEAVKRTQMIIIGITLFILTFLLNLILKTTSEYKS